MKKEVVKKEATNLPAEMSASAWGGGETYTSNDLVIPKILPLQFMSEKVREKLGEYGEFRDTLNNEKFGDLTTPFEIIPFHAEKKWIEYDVITDKKGGRKREYRAVTPINHDNDGLPYVDQDGLTERDRCIDVYCLVPSHVADGGAFPHVLSFRRTSLAAGKKIITQFLRNQSMGKPPCAVTMLVSGKSVQNDEGEYVVQDVRVGRAAEAEEIKEAFNWYQLVLKGATKLDESDIVETQAKEVEAEKF